MKEQTLLNIMRLRYGDAPVFLDVSSVISSLGSPRPADPQFEPLLAAIRRIQISGVLGMGLEKRGVEDSALLVLPDRPKPEQEPDIRFIAETLGAEDVDRA